MANQQLGLLGRKLGMTQLFDEDGAVVPVTILQAGPCRVLSVKSEQGPDGYNALQLAYGSRKVSRVNKADAGQFSKAGCAEEPPEAVREIRVTAEDAARTEAGSTLTVGDVFTEGGWVDVTGTSKGRGFAGVMKRYNFAGFERTHGVHEFFRHGGSIGTRLTPGHVLKGKKMPGQMGNAQVTVQNMLVARIDTERNLIMVRGGVPGPTGAVVTVRKAVKRS